MWINYSIISWCIIAIINIQGMHNDSNATPELTAHYLLEKCHNIITHRAGLVEICNVLVNCPIYTNADAMRRAPDFLSILTKNKHIQEEIKVFEGTAHLLITLEQLFIKNLKSYLNQQILEQDILTIKPITSEQILIQCHTIKKSYGFCRPIETEKLYNLIKQHDQAYTLIETYLKTEHENQEQFFDIRWDVVNS